MDFIQQVFSDFFATNNCDVQGTTMKRFWYHFRVLVYLKKRSLPYKAIVALKSDRRFKKGDDRLFKAIVALKKR